MSASSAANIDANKTQQQADVLASRLPDPVGYKMLVIKPEIEAKTEGGILKPQEFLRKEEAGAVVGLVLKQGDMCYKDEAKFPTGPWCKEGDFVLIGAYRGSRFTVDGKEFVIINDDMIESVVKDPRGINRAY
jgi:co-chaperonin GroES (HSP10)